MKVGKGSSLGCGNIFRQHEYRFKSDSFKYNNFDRSYHFVLDSLIQKIQ